MMLAQAQPFLEPILAQAGPTLAQAKETAINLNELLAPWLPVLMTAFMGVVVALLTWIKGEIQKRTGVVVENAHMQALQKAIENAAGAALARLSTSSKAINIDTKSEAVRYGVQYVNQSAADAVASFGLTPEQIAEKIIAKMSVITAPNPDFTIKDNTQPPPDPGAGG